MFALEVQAVVQSGCVLVCEEGRGMRHWPLIKITENGEEFDLSLLLNHEELSPQKAKDAIMAAGHAFLRQGKVSHGTFIAMDKAASPQEALLYVFNYMVWGTHDSGEHKQMLAADDEKRLQEQRTANEEAALYVQENLSKMKADLGHAEINNWTGEQ
jgi:hypothetical protein